jgi:RNA polymerase sigma-70 factor (ECF subfamily)
MEGDDLFQEAVVRAFDRLHTLREETRFRAWFYAVLLSLHRTRSRWGFWRRFAPLEPVLSGEIQIAGEDGRATEGERFRSERAARALATLPAVQREAVILHELDGFTMEEISEMQGVTVSAVKSRVSRGRQKLRRYYERLGFRNIPSRRRLTKDARFALPGDDRMVAAPITDPGRGGERQ